MRNTIKLIIIFSFFCISNCKKEQSQTPINNNDNYTSLELVWRKLQTDSNNYNIGISPIINSEGDILISDDYNKATYNNVFKLFDGKTGKLKWETNPFSSPQGSLYNYEKPIVINDIMILATYDNIYAFNIVTGKNIWVQKNDTLMDKNKIFCDNDGYIYFIKYNGDWGGHKKINIYRTKYDDLKLELVQNIVDSANNFNVGTSMAFSKNDRGEKLLIFEKDLGDWVSRIYCINLTNKTFEWINDFNNRFIVEGTLACTNQNIFINWSSLSENLIASIDLKNGNLLWEKICPIFKQVPINFFIYNNHPIFVHKTYNALSQISGNSMWETSFHNYLNTGIVFKNYIISSELSNILVYNLDNGKEVFYKKSALPGYKIQGSVTINQNTRLLYFKDENYLNCFKLPDEIVF